jgi:hypothetical protein
MNPKEISYPKQLLVEGRDTEVFFLALIRTLSLGDIQLQNFGGKDELADFLSALVASPGFKTKVNSLGVVRDADNDALSAFRSVCSGLRKSKLTVPKEPAVIFDGNPRVGVFILPNAESRGMLETICLDSVSNDPAMVCISEYFRCLEDVGLVPSNIDKAKVQAFLASRQKPGLRLGQAASKGYWQFSNQIFDNLKRFLISL